MPWVWSACSWVYSTASTQSTSASSSCSRRSGEVSTRTRVTPSGPRRSTRSEHAAAAVLRVVRIAGAPAERRPRHAAGRAAAEDGEAQRHATRLRRRWLLPRGRGTLVNSRKKFSVVWRAISSNDHAAGLGQHLGGLDHIGRLVALAAELAGREIGRVGLDQEAVGRQRRGDRAQVVGFLEGQDAGERDREAERDGAARRGRGPPVKQCSTAGKAPFPVSSSRIARHVVVGLARMDHQRQAGFARGGDVVAEAVLLRVARAVVVVIVEPGLADRHHLGMARARAPGRPW